jgi:outer membrane receptor protein involved in Fe transport
MRGTIVDASGAVLPGATVTVKSEALIGGTRTATTNEIGAFRFPSLPVGDYDVEVTMPGFLTYRLEDVPVGLESTATVNATLQVGQLAETVGVSGQSPVVDVTRAGMANSITSQLLEEIPTRRNMYDMMHAMPGMSPTFGDGQSDRVSAFGSNQQSNSWNVDGVNATAPETGSSWWTVNQDVIEEIQVIGVGAPAEFGNHTGAVLNVVTKRGGNTFRGQASYYFTSDDLTDVNVRLPESDFTFHRELYRNFTSQLGGPIKKDSTWFFGSFEYYRSASTEPGNDPSTAPTNYSDKYDLKITNRTGKFTFDGFVHHDDWGNPDGPSPFYTQSALSGERGRNPAWGGGLEWIASDRLFMEFKYAGWWSDDIHDSQTGSFDEPFIDYTPPGGGPTTYSGGAYNPWDYVTSRNQAKVKATYYAQNFLKSEHEFKMGVQYSYGTAKTNTGIGSNGSYMYNYGGYLYRAVSDPYQYGGISHDTGVFLDDRVTIGDRLTLNLGVRFDYSKGGVPDYKRLTIGTPSISVAGNYAETDEIVPGADVVNWKLVSPRLGMAFQPFGDTRSVIRASFGVYYDQNVIGNWDVPPPGKPTFQLFFCESSTVCDELITEVTSEDVAIHPDLKPPRTLQYAAGFEQQLGPDISVGTQYIYKTTKNLVGWEIIGGEWEPVAFTDPFTGREFTLLSQLDVPLTRKGNDPGDFPGSENLRYFQKYHGLAFTFAKRYANNWGLNASYTWSRSEGLIPRMLSQAQFNPFYGSREGADPNNFLNAEGRLQADRPHMFRLQGVTRLPWDFQLSTNLDFSTGKAHNRQIRVGNLGQGTVSVIMEPGGAYRFSSVRNVDVLIGKRIRLAGSAALRLEGWILNLLNDDQELSYADLRLQTPEARFTADTWVEPRRLQLRVGIQF